MKLVLTIDNIKFGTVINRPSKLIKSPYLADVNVDGKKMLAHSPALGLCGYIIKDKKVVLSYKSSNSIRKSKYTIELVLLEKPFVEKNIYLGANPIRSNLIFLNSIPFLFPKAKEIKTEIKYLSSRFDFLINNNTIIEIKNVPLVDYHESKKDVIKLECPYKALFTENKFRTAIFPDGYKKNKDLVVSPRAYRQLEDMITLVKTAKYKCYVIFIIQRSDIEYFSPNYERDKIYAVKLKEAYDSGVKILAFSYKWKITRDNKTAKCYLMKKIPIKFI